MCRNNKLSIFILAIALTLTVSTKGQETAMFDQIPDGNYYQGMNQGMYSTPCYGCDTCNWGNGILPCSSKRLNRLYIDGWVSAGASSFDQAPISTTSSPGGYNWRDDDSNNFQMNQLYLILGRDAQNGNNIGIGGRVDLLYGTDYHYTSSLGLESRNENWYGGPATTVYNAKPHWNQNELDGYPEYGIAMPQAYAELYVPIMCGLSVKAGHFYSPVGYESVMSTSNFFYSHSYSMLYGEAKTLTGVLLEQKFNQNWTGLFGIDRGWDTWEGYEDDTAYLGGVKWQNSNKTSSLAFTVSTGKQIVYASENRIGSDIYDIQKGDQTNYSLVYQQRLSNALQYVLQHDFGAIENGSSEVIDNHVYLKNGNWYSLTNYLFYQMTERFAVGVRFEWFKDEGLTRYASIPTKWQTRSGIYGYETSGNNYYNLSFGINWKPTDWITIRPEVRYDWSDFTLTEVDGTKVYAYDSGNKKDIVTVGGDAVIRF